MVAFIAPHLFNYIQERRGIAMPDPLLDYLPVYDVSRGIFLVMHFCMLISLFFLVSRPEWLLQTFVAFGLLFIFRFITLYLTPLDEPQNLLVLRDPFIDRFFYQQPITRDLFFSGHTSVLILFGLCTPHPFLRKVIFTGAVIVGCLLLVHHAHYTIDVIAAPFGAWAGYRVAKIILKRFGYIYI